MHTSIFVSNRITEILNALASAVGRRGF